MLRPLHDNWTLQPVSGPIPDQVVAAGPIPATVPGTVHTDLLAAGLIPDPYLDDHERLTAWIGLTDWRYETAFDWAPDGHDTAELVFHGLDTVATIELNGRLLARTRNMHRTYRLDVRDALVDGVNRLAVTFASAVRYADGMSLELGARPHVNHHPYNAIRKMACNFGWDWGPDLVTAGIWRAVELCTWSTARLDAVRPVVRVEETTGTVDVHVEVARADPEAELVVHASVDGWAGEVRLAPGQSTATVRVVVDDVRRWWPQGHGEQHLYDLRVGLRRPGTDQPAEAWRRRIGFRTLRWDTDQDEGGTGFTLVVNDRPIFVKGANWIPDDAFPHRVTRDRYAARLGQAREAGLNLLRVWGGGIFESDDFYDECDERGLLVWQDFLFACAAYAEEEPLRSEIAAEARDNVTRLMPHPSLALWNGGNENLWGFADWGWEARLDGRTWGAGYYHDLLPDVVNTRDPGRPYSAGSPYSVTTDRHPNDPAHGTMHIWDVWNQRDYTHYRQHRPRFVAEFGWQGPPTWSTLRRAISDEPLTPESPGMLVHQKADQGNTKLVSGLVPHLPVPDDMDDWHWAMSLNQARALRLAIEHFRALRPHCMGSVMWQLNDCWPVVSWSAIDGDGRRKPTFYAMRHAHADRLATFQPRPGGVCLVLDNDTAQRWAGPVTVTRTTFEGKPVAVAHLVADVAPWSSRSLPLDGALTTPDNPAGELLLADTGARRATWFFTEDRDSDLPRPGYRTTADEAADGYVVTVTATSLLRDLALLVDRLDPDAVVDDMLVTLMPGESVTFAVRTGARLDGSAFEDPRALRTANQLPHRVDG